MNADTCTGDIHSSKNNKTKQNKTNKQKMSFTSDQLPNIAAVIPCGGRSSISSSNSSTTNQSINTSTGTMGISDVSYHENGQTLYVVNQQESKLHVIDCLHGKLSHLPYKCESESIHIVAATYV